MSRVRSEWTLRDGYLSQVVQWHAFQREAKQILAAIASKRNTLKYENLSEISKKTKL